MDWFGKRGSGDDDDYRSDRDFDHNFYRDFDRDEYYHAQQRPRWIGHSLWGGAKELKGNSKTADVLMVAAILVSWVIALSSHGEFTRMLSLIIAGTASAYGAWWLYHRIGAQWAGPDVGVSAEAVESGLTQGTKERAMRTARRAIYTLTAAIIAINVTSTMAAGSAAGGSEATTNTLPNSVIELDSSVRSTASGTDIASVRKAWMLAGARNTTSALEITGILGQRVWLTLETSTGPSTVCIEIADSNTPAKRTPCAGLGVGAGRGQGPVLQQQAGRTSGS